jgi:hypothetical protein
MERNALIYAAADQTVVAHARFKVGGTWTGATDALRRRRTRLLIREDPTDPALRALICLGGRPLRQPSQLEDALNASDLQPQLLP